MCCGFPINLFFGALSRQTAIARRIVWRQADIHNASSNFGQIRIASSSFFIALRTKYFNDRPVVFARASISSLLQHVQTNED